MSSLPLLMTWIVKPLLICLLGLLQYRSLQRFSAAMKHIGLALALFLLPLSVLIDAVLPSVVEIPVHWHHHLNYDTPLQSLLGFYLFVTTLGIWYLLTGVFIVLRRHPSDKTLSGYECVQREINQLRSLTGIKRPVTLILADNAAAPASWGLFKPRLLLPQAALDWSESQRKLILLHELAHIARHDWLILLLARTITYVFWFLPPVWWIKSLLEDAAERACDDWVLTLEGRSEDYADTLLQQEKNLKQEQLPVTPLMGRTNFQRICAVLEEHADHDIDVRQDWRHNLLLSALALGLISAIDWVPTDSPWSSKGHSFWVLPPTDKPSIDRWNQWQQPLESTPPKRPQAVVSPPRPATEFMLVTESFSASKAEITQSPQTTESLEVKPNVTIQGFLPTRMVTPRYPVKALRKDIQGHVIVRFHIDANGTPYDEAIVEAQPKGVFEQAVLDSLRQSRFRAPQLNGEPVALKNIEETFYFRLTSHQSNPRASPVPSNSKQGYSAIAFDY